MRPRPYSNASSRYPTCGRKHANSNAKTDSDHRVCVVVCACMQASVKTVILRAPAAKLSIATVRISVASVNGIRVASVDGSIASVN